MVGKEVEQNKGCDVQKSDSESNIEREMFNG